jgi:hypothetical protein
MAVLSFVCGTIAALSFVGAITATSPRRYAGKELIASVEEMSD